MRRNTAAAATCDDPRLGDFDRLVTEITTRGTSGNPANESREQHESVRLLRASVAQLCSAPHTDQEALTLAARTRSAVTELLQDHLYGGPDHLPAMDRLDDLITLVSGLIQEEQQMVEILSSGAGQMIARCRARLMEQAQ